MAERSRRQALKRQISDVTDESPEVSESDSDDFDPRKTDAARRGGKQESQPQTSTSPNTSRAKRGVQPQTPPSPSSSNGHSIKLTMKVAPSKLREVMRANEVDSLKDTLGGGTVLDGPRSSRARSGVPSSSQASPPTSEKRTGGRNAGRPKYHEVAESDDDAEGEDDVDVGMNDFDEIGAEAEGGTDEEDDEEDESEEEEDDDNDVDMEDSPAPVLPVKKNVMPPKAPKITLKTPARDTHGKQPAKPEVVVTPAQVGPVQSVEDEEMEEDDDDEELDDSELPDDDNNELSDAEVEDELDDTNINQEDVEGVTNLNEEDEEEDDDDDLSDDESGLASGTATPDPAKLTARQRRHGGEELMSLDMAPQQRKFFTDAEKAMKKDEHARKRKELTKRKIHEEKTAALNRLLKPQVSKARGAAPKAETLAAQMAQAGADVEAALVEKADPLYTRWISDKDGVRLGVPEEWLGKKVGRYFAPLPNGRLIQEVD